MPNTVKLADQLIIQHLPHSNTNKQALEAAKITAGQLAKINRAIYLPVLHTLRSRL